METERIIELLTISDSRGSLSVLETGLYTPLGITQISDVTNSQIYEQQDTLFIALKGVVEIRISNRSYILDRPDKALYIPADLPLEIKQTSADALCMGISFGTDNSKYDKPSGTYSIHNCPLIKLTEKEKGQNLCSIKNIPFDTKRIFYIYNIPAQEERGMHAHKFCHEILIAVRGSFEVELDDGTHKKVITLDNPAYGLHIPPGIWAVERKYSEDAICLVLASDKYDAENYINSYSDFIKYRQNGN